MCTTLSNPCGGETINDCPGRNKPNALLITKGYSCCKVDNVKMDTVNFTLETHQGMKRIPRYDLNEIWSLKVSIMLSDGNLLVEYQLG